MLIDAIRGLLSGDYYGLIQLLLALPIMLFSLTVHEYSHGWVARKCGDHTAENLGRLTLDPIKHLDPIGFLCMLLFGFGWAKPVPINSRYFKNPRRDMALTALAGPVSNLLLGFLFAILMETTSLILTKYGEALGNPIWLAVLLTFFASGMQLNVYLAVFNMLPIPPFDGSRIFFIFLPVKWYFGIMKYERYIMIALLVLLWTGILTLPLGFIANAIISGMLRLLSLVFPGGIVGIG